MKTLITIFALMIFSLTSFASSDVFNEKADKYDKLRKKVAFSADATSLMEAAKVCIVAKENMSEAYTWLNKSIELKPTAENLELQGDYFALHGLDQLASESYRKALVLKIGEGKDFKGLQKKMLAFRR